MGFTGATRPQLTEVEIVLHKRDHADQEQPFFTVSQGVRLHADGAQQHIHPFILRKCFAPLFQFFNVHMRHLDWRELSDADWRSVPIFLHVLIVQLHDAPDAAAKQTVKFGGIFFVYGDILESKVRELCFIEIPLDVQVHCDFIDHGVAATLTKHRENLLRLIGADEIIRKNAFYILYALFNNIRVIRAAILSQQELKDIDRHICAFLDFLGQILAHNLPIEILPQFRFDDSSSILIFCHINHLNRLLSLRVPLKAEAIVIGKCHVHDDRMPEHLKPCCIIVYYKEILFVFVVLLVFELEFHAEDAFGSILFPAVRDAAILIGNPLVIIGDKEQPIRSSLDHIADRLRLNEIQYGDLIGDFSHHAYQRNSRAPRLHVTSFHLEAKDRHKHFLRG